MANIRKAFNFRNGVQVDDDNLIVSPTGLVGIGTTVPTELLDVRGTAKVVGLVTASQVYTPALTAVNATINNLTLSSSLVGGGVSIRNGIITASSLSGVVTYYGDGGRLSNLPTSQWLDVDVGLGFTSIYAQGFVGVSTNDPRYALQVGGSLAPVGGYDIVVGVDALGNIYATGIITAGQFSGIGSNLTLLNANNISSGTISTDRIPQLPNSKLPSNINVSGVITASSGFSGNLTGNVIGIATTARDLTSNAIVSIESVSSNYANFGISTVTTRLNVVGSTGIGTNGTPQSDLHISKSGISSIQISSNNSESYLTLSRGLNQTLNAGSIKYGNQIGIYPYSNTNSFDIINYDLGNVNSYIHLGVSTGIGTGSFNWIYGKDPISPLMSLTYQGNLGLGNTAPTVKLDVVGNASISGNLNVLSDVSIGSSVTVANLYVTNTASIPGITAGGTGIATGVYVTSGVSTVYDLEVTGPLVYLPLGSSIGIGTTQPSGNIQVGLLDASVIIEDIGIGIGTTSILPAIGLDARSSIALFESIGVGTVFPGCAVDFSLAGVGVNTSGRFVRVPVVTNATKTTINAEIDDVDVQGGIVFNSSTNNFEGFVGAGSSWVNLGIQTSVINSNQINNSGIVTTGQLRVGTGVTVNSGVVTATNGFTSGIGTAVQITTVGNQLVFTVPGVGTTSLTLY